MMEEVTLQKETASDTYGRRVQAEVFRNELGVKGTLRCQMFHIKWYPLWKRQGYFWTTDLIAAARCNCGNVVRVNFQRRREAKLRPREMREEAESVGPSASASSIWTLRSSAKERLRKRKEGERMCRPARV